MRSIGFYMRMNINEVDRAWTGCGQDAEGVAFGIEWIESAQCVSRWMIPARNVSLCTEARFQRNCGNPIACLRRDSPSTDVGSSEGTELPKCFIIEIPTGMFAGNGSRYSPAD